MADLSLHGTPRIKEVVIPPIYSTMKETYTTILRTNPLLRSPRSARSSDCLRNLRPAIACRGCGNENDRHHPCMFCTACLSELKYNLKEKGSPRLKVSSSFGSDDSDLTAWNRSLRGADTARSNDGRQTRTGTREVILNSSLSFQEDAQASPRARPQVNQDLTPQQKCYRRLWKQKSKTFELTHAFCGFCGINTNRSEKLGIYCMHCRKHLCREHALFHEQVKIYRPHALINLTRGANNALL